MKIKASNFFLQQSLAVSLFVVILLYIGCSEVLAQESGRYELGKTVFSAKCVLCHGAGGVGTKTGPPLVNKIYRPGHHGDFSFNLAVNNGVRAHHWKFGSMKPVKGVNRAEIEAIIVYIRTLQKEAGIF